MKTKIPSDTCAKVIKDRFYYSNGKLFYNYSFNRCIKDTEAGVEDPRGYKRVSVLKSKMLVHRIIWFLHKNEWPDTLDHIDQDKSNNHIENLRPCNFFTEQT